VGISLANSLAEDLYAEEVLGSGMVNVPYTKGKSAKYYVDRYAAGVGETGKRKLITVRHPSGEIQRTKNFLFFKIYPKVEKGTVVRIGKKKEKPEREQREREDTDWGKVVANSIAQVTAVLTLVLLTQRLD